MLLFFIGCAKIQPPPGGPEDKTPPRVVTSTPQSGAVNVDRSAPVRLEFSEPVNRDKIGEAVYISPRPSADPTFGWDKNALLIEWPESLAANITYLITVAARVQDRRGNRLAEPFTLAFSTGTLIDSGAITGIVFDRDKPAADAQVLVFVLPLDSANAIFAMPDYITEGGGDGGYLFSYLPNGRYHAIAVEDKNKNHLLDHGEKAGIGAFDVELSGPIRRSPPLYLYLREMDTTRFELVRCRVNTDRVLLAEFSHPVDSLSAGTASWAIESIGIAVKPEIECLELDAKSAKTVRLSLRGVNIGVSYRLSVRQLVDQLGSEIDSAFNRAEFFWPTAPDTVAPSVISSTPGHREDGVDPHRSLEIQFSEAVDSAQIDRSFYVADSTGAHVAGSIIWSCPWQMTFIAESVLVERTTYMLVLDSGSVRDSAGNVMLKRWAASFATANPDNLGSVAGTIQVKRDDWSDKPIVLEFVPVEKKLPLVAQRLYRQNAFEYDIPAGRYVMRVFVDINENRRFDYGAVVHFQFAEPRFFFPDTIDVRARFVTEGLELTVP